MPYESRGNISRAVLKRLYASFGGMCAIPDCPYPNQLSDGTPTLEVAHIESVSPNGVRYNSSRTLDELNQYENLILLCPAHHREVDSASSFLYSATKLRAIRDRHVGRVTGFLEAKLIEPPKNAISTNRLQKALQIWHKERHNGSEEFWQKLFVSQPELLAATVQGRPFRLNPKSYVGGKGINNKGGNVLDFLLQHDGDVVLVEIKTPTKGLIGAEYRTNIYSPSGELAGAVSQVLTYRLSLLNDLRYLAAESPGLTVHSPSMFVIIGDLEREGLSRSQRRSFELFRAALKDIVILTYDELFAGISDMASLMESL